MAIYDAGTASLAANGTVTGVGTTWQAPLTLIRVGATIVFKTEPVKIYTISEIISDTQINVYNPNSETVPAGTGYAILAHDGITVQGLAQDVAETLRYYQSRETEVADAVDAFNNFDAADFETKVMQVNTQHMDVVNIGSQVEASAMQVSADKDSAASSAASASSDKDAAAASAQEAADYAASLDTTNLLRKDLALSDLTDKELARQNLNVYSKSHVDLIDKANNVASKFGAVADYNGNPEYDGNDSSRVTFTDNTGALLNALTIGSVSNETLYLYFPQGHYGFSGEKISINQQTSPYKKLVIFGDGSNLTILDYIKEDSTGTGNTEQGENAKELLRITGFDEVEFKGLTLKCTTKRGFVNGTPSSDPANAAIYNGTIWFTHIKDARNVSLVDVIAEYGNYRCISIDGVGDISESAKTNLYMKDCIGRYNTGSGFWLRGIKTARLHNCQGYRNGNLGVTATGYGVTFSQYCEDIIINGGAFYENYRKGIDKHGGLGNITIKNALIADNIMFQASFDHQYVGFYGQSENTDMQLYGVSIEFGRNPDFCNEALNAIDLQYRNHISLLLNDKLINGTTASRLRSVVIDNLSINYLDGVTAEFNSFSAISEMAKRIDLNDVNIDLEKLKVNKTGNKNVYTLIPLIVGADNSSIKIMGGTYKSSDGMFKDLNGADTNSLFISGNSTINIDIGGGAEFDLNNHVLVGTTGSGRAYDFSGGKRFGDCSFKIRNLQNITYQFVAGTGISWIENGTFFGNTANKVGYGGSVMIGLGDCNSMFEHKFGVNDSDVRFKVGNTSLQQGTTLSILTGNQYGNIDLVMTGRSVSSGDTLHARWIGSQNTHQVVTASSNLSTGAITDSVVQWNGSPTNLVLKSININTTTSLATSQYYLASICGNNSYTLKFAGFK